MANTYTQLYYHIIFAVKGRVHLISPKWKDDLFKYISGVITNKKQKLYIINGVKDHVHILLSTSPNSNLSILIRDIKSSSSKWINNQKYLVGKFEWQSGFGAFTIGHSQIPKLIEYIKKQEEHHKTKTFKDEYISFLEAYNIDYKNEYLFK